jgi:hypothetical protein
VSVNRAGTISLPKERWAEGLAVEQEVIEPQEVRKIPEAFDSNAVHLLKDEAVNDVRGRSYSSLKSEVYPLDTHFLG